MKERGEKCSVHVDGPDDTFDLFQSKASKRRDEIM